MTRDALSRYVPDTEPRQHLWDLVAEYPGRGGKAIRPALCLATTVAFGGELDEALPSAVALELLHNAFLVHDDIEDASLLRRGRPTLHAEHGVPWRSTPEMRLRSSPAPPCATTGGGWGAGWPHGSATSSI